MTNRRINDFDNFINANPNKMHSPRNLPLNINNFNTLPNLAQEKSQRHVSPNRISNTSKPMISPSNSHRNPMSRPKGKFQIDTGRDYYCPSQNHPPRKAEFAIKVEGIDTFYCQICAAHAASQGFTVRRINKKQRTVPHYAQYIKNQKYIQITEFMNNILQLQNEYKKIQTKKGREHYKQQIDMLNSFYDSLQSIVQKMREDHIADMLEECEENAARETMGIQNLKIHLDQLNQSWQDIENNIQKIVEDVDERDFIACMQKYNKDLRVFNHKLEEFQDQKQSYTSYSQNELNKKINSFETKLMEIWQENQSSTKNHFAGYISNKTLPQTKTPSSQSNYQSNPSTTIRNVHQMLPKQVMHKNGQGQDPFRNLFPEQEEERLPEASPQFKAF